MSKMFSIERPLDRSVDYSLLALLFLMIGLGTSSMYSASAYLGERLFKDNSYFLLRQLLRIFLGSIGAFAFSIMPIEKLKKFIPHLLVVTIIFMLLTYLPGIGARVMGARRWIFLGPLSFQPSELVKFTLIIYLAYMLAKNEGRDEKVMNTFVPPLIVVMTFVFLIYLQNDFSSSIFLLILAFFMFFIAGLNIRYIIPIVVFSVPLAFIFLFTKPYRVNRLISFLFPQSDPSGAGYQILAARKALSLGGFWGMGPGQGVRKMGKLPEVHADFIFASIGEELGFLGVLIVLGLFIAFTYKGFRVADGASDRFQYYLALGITLSISLQAFMNMGVVCGVLPSTGIPLPFFSYGGSSILITLVMVGLLLNISRKSTEEYSRLYRGGNNG